MKIPRFFTFSLLFLGLIFAWTFIYRLLIWYFVFPDNLHEFSSEIQQSFYLGLKFDMKFCLILSIPLFIIVTLFRNSFFSSKSWRIFYMIYAGLVFFIINWIYIFDVGHYLYLRERLNASILKFLKDIGISMNMVWESYPVILILVVFILVYLLQLWLSKKLYDRAKFHEHSVHKRGVNIAFGVLLTLISALGVYGSFSYYPLRWSEAFFSKNKDIGQLTLNPGLYFAETFNFAEDSFDKKKTQNYYPTMVQYLEIQNPNIQNLNYQRHFMPLQDSLPKAKNIVFIMMESLGAPYLGSFNNPMKEGSPFLNDLSKTSWFFPNFYVPRFGTARTVFASMTGIPDITLNETASRNPAIIDQRIIFDQFKDMEKMYFLGGSANWANIRAVFSNNISGVQIFEEGTYNNESRVDVWGINDYDLFMNAHNQFEKLSKQGKHFAAYVQSSAFHSPYTVPEQERGYKALKENEVDMELLKKSGFISLEHYNSLRYFDYNLQQFFEKIKHSSYYDDTVFILFGDHNGHVEPFNHTANPEYETGVQETHVPLFIVGKHIKPYIDTRFASLVDIMPTGADLLGKPYINYTLGKSILRRPMTDNGSAFIYTPIFGKMTAATLYGNFLLYYDTDVPSEPKLIKYTHQDYKTEVQKKYPQITHHLDSLTKGFYYSTQYLFFNNRKN